MKLSIEKSNFLLEKLLKVWSNRNEKVKKRRKKTFTLMVLKIIKTVTVDDSTVIGFWLPGLINVWK
jgi:hypothetical protein